MKSPLGEFLRARRGQVTPSQVGLPPTPGRKVRGLRREEVASLAAISPEYYLRLEQGRQGPPSSQVIDALARALLLGSDGVHYMRRLVRLQSGPAVVGRPDPDVWASLEATLGMWRDIPAAVLTPTGDVVLSNEAADEIAGSAVAVGTNLVITVFSERFREYWVDWEATARKCLANLRWRSNPHDPHLQEIVGLLSLHDPDFRRIWARHDAYPADLGATRFVSRKGQAGTLRFQNLDIPGTPDWMVMVMQPEIASAPPFGSSNSVVSA